MRACITVCIRGYRKPYTPEMRGFRVCGRGAAKVSRLNLSVVSGPVADQCPACWPYPAIPKRRQLALFSGRQELLPTRTVPPGGISRLCDQEHLPGGQATLSGSLHGYSPCPPSFHVCIPAMPWDTCKDTHRPAIQLPALSPDCDLKGAPPAPHEPPRHGPDPEGLSCLFTVPLLVGPNHESMEDGQLTVAALILPDWQCEGRSRLFLFLAGSPGL